MAAPARGRGRDLAQAADQLVGEAELAVRLAIRHGAQVGGQVLGAPGQRQQPLRRAHVAGERGDGQRRLRGDGHDGRRGSPGRAGLEFAEGPVEFPDVGDRIGLRQHDAGGHGGHHRAQVVVHQARGQRVHPHPQFRAGARPRRVRRNAAAICRASGLRSGTTASSRSRMTASAPEPRARASFRSLSAGTNSQLRGSARPLTGRAASAAARGACSWRLPRRAG